MGMLVYFGFGILVLLVGIYFEIGSFRAEYCRVNKVIRGVDK